MRPLDHKLHGPNAGILGLFFEVRLASEAVAPVLRVLRLKVLVWRAPCTSGFPAEAPM
jgi:hypothetical protein